MHKVQIIEKPYRVCDSCDYALGKDELVITLTIPWPADGSEPAEFHFHAPLQDGRHDCFRCWAHDHHHMERSLKRRGWDEVDIDAFMATMLYRKTPFGYPDKIVVVQS